MISKLLFIALTIALLLGEVGSVNAIVEVKSKEFQKMPVYQPSPEPLPADLDKKTDLFNPDLEQNHPEQTIFISTENQMKEIEQPVQGKPGIIEIPEANPQPVIQFNRTQPTQDIPIVPPELADVNQDGIVNDLDLQLVGEHFAKKISKDTPWDVNKDGMVNIFDLVLVATNIGKKPDGNDSPKFTDVPNGPFKVGVNGEFRLYLKLSDADGDPLALVVENPADGEVKVDMRRRSPTQVEAQITWIPHQQGEYHLNIRLEDGKGGFDQIPVEITVTERVSKISQFPQSSTDSFYDAHGQRYEVARFDGYYFLVQYAEDGSVVKQQNLLDLDDGIMVDLVIPNVITDYRNADLTYYIAQTYLQSASPQIKKRIAFQVDYSLTWQIARVIGMDEKVDLYTKGKIATESYLVNVSWGAYQAELPIEIIQKINWKASSTSDALLPLFPYLIQEGMDHPDVKIKEVSYNLIENSFSQMYSYDELTILHELLLTHLSTIYTKALNGLGDSSMKIQWDSKEILSNLSLLGFLTEKQQQEVFDTAIEGRNWSLADKMFQQIKPKPFIEESLLIAILEDIKKGGEIAYDATSFSVHLIEIATTELLSQKFIPGLTSMLDNPSTQVRTDLVMRLLLALSKHKEIDEKVFYVLVEAFVMTNWYPSAEGEKDWEFLKTFAQKGDSFKEMLSYPLLRLNWKYEKGRLPERVINSIDWNAENLYLALVPVVPVLIETYRQSPSLFSAINNGNILETLKKYDLPKEEELINELFAIALDVIQGKSPGSGRISGWILMEGLAGHHLLSQEKIENVLKQSQLMDADAFLGSSFFVNVVYRDPNLSEDNKKLVIEISINGFQDNPSSYVFFIGNIFPTIRVEDKRKIVAIVHQVITDPKYRKVRVYFEGMIGLILGDPEIGSSGKNILIEELIKAMELDLTNGLDKDVSTFLNRSLAPSANWIEMTFRQGDILQENKEKLTHFLSEVWNNVSIREALYEANQDTLKNILILREALAAEPGYYQGIIKTVQEIWVSNNREEKKKLPTYLELITFGFSNGSLKQEEIEQFLRDTTTPFAGESEQDYQERIAIKIKIFETAKVIIYDGLEANRKYPLKDLKAIERVVTSPYFDDFFNWSIFVSADNWGYGGFSQAGTTFGTGGISFETDFGGSDTLIHEFGHMIMWYYWNSFSKRWSILYDQGYSNPENFVSSYADNSFVEDIPETLLAWATDSFSQLKTAYQNRAKAPYLLEKLVLLVDISSKIRKSDQDFAYRTDPKTGIMSRLDSQLILEDGKIVKIIIEGQGFDLRV